MEVVDGTIDLLAPAFQLGELTEVLEGEVLILNGPLSFPVYSEDGRRVKR
jgi:hypothetical protein